MSTGVLGGCASSAIEMDQNPSEGGDSTSPTDDTTDNSSDDSTGDLDAGPGNVTNPRDAAPRSDAGTTSDAAAAIDAGGAKDGSAPKDAAAPTKDATAPVVDASQPPVVDASTPPPLMCTGSTGTACSGQCVDLRSDASNCGNCGVKCSATQTCTNSACVNPAPPTQVPANCTAKTYNNHTYGFCSQTREWSDARSSCISAGLDLVIINDANENNFVKSNAGSDSWLGISDQDKEGSYVDVVPGNNNNTNGAGQGYFNWRQGEPSNSQYCDGINIVVGCLGKKSDEDCEEMYSSDGTWNDELCTRSHAYVCESY